MKNKKLKAKSLALLLTGISQTFLPVIAQASGKVPKDFSKNFELLGEENETESAADILIRNGASMLSSGLTSSLGRENLSPESEDTDPHLEKQMDPVFIAIQQGNIGSFLELVKIDHSAIKKRDAKNRTPFMFAFQLNVELAMALFTEVSKICEPNEVLEMLSAVDKDGTSIMHLVSKIDGLRAFAEFLISASGGKLLSVKDHNGKTPLHFAVEANAPSMIEFLCGASRGELILSGDCNGRTPLHYSASNNVSVFDFLLKVGAESSAEVEKRLKVRDRNGAAPIHYAAFNNSMQVLDYIQKLNFPNGELFKLTDANKKTPLHYAAQGGSNDAITFLLERLKELGVTSLAIDSKKHTPLHCAIKSDNVESVKIFLNLISGENFNPVNTLGPKGMTILHYAIKHGAFHVVSAILELFSANGVDVNAIEDKKGRNIFFYVKDKHVAKNDEGEIPLAAWLIFKGIIKPDRPDSKGRYILHYAVFGGQMQTVKNLLASGMPINLTDTEGRTPFMYALKANNEDMIKFILQNNNKDVLDTKTVDGKNCLFYAVDNCSLALVQCLVSGGISLSPEIKNSDNMNLLHYSAYHGKLDTTEYLLNSWKTGFSGNNEAYLSAVNAQDSKGTTPLLYACQIDSPGLINLLVSNGADCNISDSENRTCLHYAAKSGADNLVKFLLMQKANPTMKDKKGKTPLHYAENAETAKLLIAAGANPEEIDKNLRTPLFDAIEDGNLDVFIILVATYKVDTNHTDAKGNTPIFIAAQKDSLFYAKFLLENGAQLDVENEENYTPEEIAQRCGSSDVLEFFKQLRSK